MTTNQADLGALYDISLSISPSGTLEETAGRALSAYVEALDCSAGAVFERVETAGGGCYYDVVTAMPDRTDRMQTAVDRVCDGSADHLPTEPAAAMVSGDCYHVVPLPGYGVLVLTRDENRLDRNTIDALEPLNENLADACRAKQAASDLREERNRFEAVFETIQEPLVNVVYRDGEPVVTRINDAFEETFGYDRSEAIGSSVNDLIVPEGEEFRETAAQIDDRARQGQYTHQEVQRETVTGIGDFLLRGVPVEATDEHEHFAMYIDITEEKERQRSLERLYDETEAILSASDREAICARTVTAATDILGSPLVGIYLYDRTEQALTAVSTTGGVDVTFGGEPPTYTEEGTVVWDVYDTGEPVFVRDVESFEGTLPTDETPAGSAMILPLGSHGVFIISSTETGVFDDADFSFARLLSKLVETALDRAQRIQGLEGVQHVTRETLTATDHETVADVALDRIPDVFDLPISGIWQYDDAKDALEPVGSTPMAEELFGEMPTFEPGTSIAWRAFEQGSIEIIDELTSDPEVYNEDSVLGSEICVPIGEFGVLATGSTHEESFTKSEQRLLDTLGANLETTMRLISRRQELELLDQVLARILRHNIRNDLTIIMGLAEGIEARSEGEPAEDAGQIIDRCKSLQATAEHASEIRHIVINRDQRDQLSFRDVVERTVSAVRTEYPDAQIETRFEVDPSLVVHPDLPVAIRHLVENGIEHNTGQPTVSVSVTEADGEIVLTVSDDGPGIPAHEVEVLDKHGESALEHGSGVGLWIVDRVVDYSDGVLSFDTSGEGTTVRVRFER
jgi:PAS domain S-box-containing protein